MNYEILFAVVVVAIFTSAVIPPVLKKFRHEFCVPEGWTGLMYHHGLYVRRNNGGRHILWGIGWTMNLIDLRKTSLLVAGQEVLTADSVGLKLSLLVTYQVTEPVTLVLGMPGGFVPLRNGKPDSAGGAKENGGAET